MLLLETSGLLSMETTTREPKVQFRPPTVSFKLNESEIYSRKKLMEIRYDLHC